MCEVWCNQNGFGIGSKKKKEKKEANASLSAASSVRCADCRTRQVPVAVVSSPHRRFVQQ
jgi:hypothetical protein